MEQKQIDIEEKAEQLYDYIIRFMDGNHKYSEVKQFLMDDGMEEATARAVIEKVLELKKKKAKKQMQGGALVIFIGVILIVLGYILPFDGTVPRLHLITIWPIIIGAVMFFRGLSNSR